MSLHGLCKRIDPLSGGNGAHLSLFSWWRRGRYVILSHFESSLRLSSVATFFQTTVEIATFPPVLFSVIGDSRTLILKKLVRFSRGIAESVQVLSQTWAVRKRKKNVKKSLQGKKKQKEGTKSHLKCVAKHAKKTLKLRIFAGPCSQEFCVAKNNFFKFTRKICEKSTMPRYFLSIM